MGNTNQIFREFYSQYDYTYIKKAYGTFLKQPLFAKLYKKVPFSVEIRMKKDVLAMQLNTENVVSMELVTVIGYFFDRYSDDRNCVWTNDGKNIKKFFRQGISKFIEYGGKISLNIADEDAEKIVQMLESKPITQAMHDRLCREFKGLETKDWAEYERDVEVIIIREEEEKHIEEVTCMDLPLDWDNAFANDDKATGVHTDSASDGLILSLNNLGRVDIEYIAQITGQDCKAVISELKGSIYQNPETWNECFYKGWETADEYLSGRVADKLKKAKQASKKYKGYFDENINALHGVMPKAVTTDEIYITLGSPWVPTDVIDAFIEHLLGPVAVPDDPKLVGPFKKHYAVKHDEAAGVWKVPVKILYKGSVKSRATYGTKQLEAGYIIERTLNMKSVAVTEKVDSLANKSGKKRIVNKSDTILAQEKQKKIIEEFQSWVWQDEERKKRLQKIYDEKYGAGVIRHYDGQFLSFPRMNPGESLFDYQKDAVARIMFSPNTLLAHDVGAGKTFTMIAAGMEMRRIGTSRKNMYVVPNTLTGQWKEVFMRLYPDADILCIEPDDFTKKKREAVLKDIRDNDYDGIIIPYSSFELIPLSNEYYCEQLEEQVEQLREKVKNNVISPYDKKLESLTQKLEELKKASECEWDITYFDELGINTLFVDEAHNFKNVPIETQVKRVLGLSINGSAKCQDMMNKVHAVQKANNGGGVVFATGTPISNSLTDIYVMQKYLQSGELALLDLQSFDSWIGMFAECQTDFEVDVDTSNFRLATRFTKFHNMPELAVLLSSIADFHQVDTSNGIPDMNGYSDVVISKTDEFAQYLKEISDRADDVRKGNISRKDDNMLKITTDGRKAALDLRLVNPQASFDYRCKAACCAENAYDIYMQTSASNSTQLIFCDTSIPKAGFNLYDELKRLLSVMGIDPAEIAYIHDAPTESKREALFERVRKGEVRILIGSTFKLGLGVNVQDKLYAIHHLDVPWRPSDMIQREGRILRNGNQNKEVKIFRYIAEGSFDAYSWQLLEAKQRTISAVLSGCVTERMCTEIADTVLDYAEVKALSIGNPLLKKRVETTNELVRHLTLQKRLIETRQALEQELTQLPGKISRQMQRIAACEKDIPFYAKNKREYSKTERKRIRQFVFREIMSNELATQESIICSYQGFDIVLPTNMDKTKPYVYLQNNGRYYVELGLAESGILIRIDNFLEELERYKEKQKANLEKLYQRETDIRAELKKEDSYANIINKLKDDLARIDKKLGVKK